MKKYIAFFKDIIRSIFDKDKSVVFMTLILSFICGITIPFSVWINSKIFDIGILVASGEAEFIHYVPYLILFVLIPIIQILAGDVFFNTYILAKCRLILRTSYKERLMEKLKKIRYECFEESKSIEIIHKVFNRIEDETLSLFPISVQRIILSGVVSFGILYIVFNIKWWLVPIIIIPFVIESIIVKNNNKNTYEEMEQFWKRDVGYAALGNILRSRDFIQNNYLYNASEYLISVYKNRLHSRNKEYESFFIGHLKRNLLNGNITKLSQISTVCLLLILFFDKEISIGVLISVTMSILGVLFSEQGLYGLVNIIRTSGYHIKNYDFLNDFFNLPEENDGNINDMPKKFDIDFEDVYFTYPGTDMQVLSGLTMHIRNGEKIALVGENGCGKTTIIKLLLGLFKPDSGKIKINGKNIFCYSTIVRNKMIGTIFQDYVKYNISLKENIAVGSINDLDDFSKIAEAMEAAKVNEFAKELSNGIETVLGREFEDSVDISGGQWQRVAIARAFMGNKPILILDEPTSQLDPISESQLYSEFAEMSIDKTAILITHRLGATMIADRIFVVNNGLIAESGTHKELMNADGIYAKMFNAQKQWYKKEGDLKNVK